MVALGSIAHAEEPYTLADYNASLVDFGVPFYEHYPASYYTGFAPRVEAPNRIHFRAGRGNQVRLTAVLDQYTILTYLYSLTKRYDVYGAAEKAGMTQAKSMAQLDAFKRVVDSPAYNIRGVIEDFENERINREQFYEASLKLLSELNPHRVFNLSLDLRGSFLEWKEKIKTFAQTYDGDPTDLELVKRHLFHPDKAIILANGMLFGRVNAFYLDDEQIDNITHIISSVLTNPDDETEFLTRTRDLFKSVTQDRYSFDTVVDGQFVPALQCEKPAERCDLRYPEFTAIYPNGSVVGSTRDRHKNTIHMIRNNSLNAFIDRPYHDVDHIRREGYYGYAPKMDWENIGNGIHNPGVSHYLPGTKNLYAELGIPEEYKFIWVVSRGPVSHGCVRMSTGHLWEVRQIFPASPERMKSLHYYGNHSADYDVFDIDGDGTPEVMGTQYLIAYSVQGASGDARRKGKNFSLEGVTKDDFYENLYGATGQYTNEGDAYVFSNPHVSHFRKANPENQQGTVFSEPLQGDFKLYEQPYEKDKAQIYRLPAPFDGQLGMRDNNKSTGKRMVRAFGRASACGPFKEEWSLCYEDQFDQDFDSLKANL